MYTIFNLLILIFLLFNIIGTAQSKKTAPNANEKSANNLEKDFSRKPERDSAAKLLVDIGDEASKLPLLQDKISIKIEVVKVLLPIKKDSALGFLESAWQDVSAVSKEESQTKNLIAAKNKIIALAIDIAPEKADKWQKSLESEKQKSNEENKESKPEESPQNSRQKADVMLKAAIAKLNNNPQVAVSEALFTLNSTSTISGYFFEFFQKLTANKQYELLENLKSNLADYATIHPSDDIQDLGAVSSLLTSNLISDLESQRKFIYFLLNSTKQISINQAVMKKSPDETFKIFQALQIFVRPAILRFSPEDLPTFDNLLKDVSSGVASEELENPLLNSDTIETQIEKAEKVTGFEERDRRLTKIVLWLLSKRMRDSKNDIVNLAQSATDKITDLDARGKLSDFVKIIEIDRLITDKDFLAAEKKSTKISQPEWRAWTLMALGNLQQDNKVIANDFYEDSSKNLQKSNNSAYKAQLIMDLASVQFNANQQSAFNTLSEGVKILNKITENDSKKKRLGFFYEINELRFDSNDLSQMQTNDIYFQPSLSKFAILNWNQTLFISQDIKPLLLRLKFQLLISKAILKKFSKSAQL